MKECHHGAKANLKGEVENLLVSIQMLTQQGLTCARLVRSFMHCRVQPLKACQWPMHQYSSVDEPDHHSSMSLALTEIEARVKIVTALSSGSFMDEDSPLLLFKDVVSTLVSFFYMAFLLICLSLFVHLMRFLQGIEPLAPSLLPSLSVSPSK